MTASGPETPDVVKACCAAAYQSDAVALVLGESYHPGGLGLTRRLARTLGLGPGMRVLDVAAGPGGTALLLAREFGCEVVGVDLGAQTVERAGAAARQAGLADRVRFEVGDAEQLPFDEASFDAVVCECAFCTFPDKPTAARELARVLRPGGRAGITDVTVAPGGLPAELADLTGWVACLADARPLDEYATILASAGLRTTVGERHDDALRRMVEQIDARLRVLRMTGRSGAFVAVDFDRALALTAQAASAVEQGAAGYGLLVAEKEGLPFEDGSAKRVVRTYRGSTSPMKLTILAVPDCPNAPLLRERLAEVLGGAAAGTELTEVEVTEVVVTDGEQAEALGMHGSPTLLIDGVDPFAEPGQPAGLSCRLFREAGGPAAGAPSVDRLRQALRVNP